jgi:branched-chain amino acid transport system substrate-binding protein
MTPSRFSLLPAALKTAKPGTGEFREAICQAFISEREIAVSQGVQLTEKDRSGPTIVGFS